MSVYQVGDKVRILDIGAIFCGGGRWRNGDVVEVVRMSNDRPLLARFIGDNYGLVISHDELHAIELVKEAPKLTKKSRIEALERRVAELERQAIDEPTPNDTITSVYDVKLGDKIAVEDYLSIYLRAKSSYEVVAIHSEKSDEVEKIVVLDDDDDNYALSATNFAKLRKVAS